MHRHRETDRQTDTTPGSDQSRIHAACSARRWPATTASRQAGRQPCRSMASILPDNDGGSAAGLHPAGTPARHGTAR